LSDVSQLEELCKEMKEFLTSLPLLKIILAFNPSAHFLDRMKMDLSSTIHKAVLHIKYDNSLIAGIIISWKDSLFDYSLLKEIQSDKV
jgi:F0F1-type ATP synthase delta subunit